MPVVDSEFRPARGLGNAHLQTIWPVLFRHVRAPSLELERLELADGDFLDLEWARDGNERLVIVSHGLESDASAGYVRGMMRALGAAKWDSLAWSFRGCGPEPNRLLRLYHSGETGDLGLIVKHAAERARYRQIALVGFSLGGNLTLKYLGEAPPHPAVVAGMAISAPIDLTSSARKLDARWDNRIYLRRFLRSLIAKVEAKAVRFPDELDISGIRKIRSFQEFDDRYTSRIHGFRDAADYWTRASARPFLGNIRLPALLVNARDDPFLGAECYPVAEAEASDSFFLEAPERGGHVGFVDDRRLRSPTWVERRTEDFLRRNAG